MVLQHLGLVRALAARIHRNLPMAVDLDDLVQAGVLGLLDALEKYDPSRNVPFHCYAKHRINGAIFDSLRQLDSVPRSVRQNQKRVECVAHDLGTKLGRTPVGSEIAEQFGGGIERWHHILMQLKNVSPVTGFALDSHRARTQDIAESSDSRPDRICERNELRLTVARAIECLPERYRRVVFLYYKDDLTMKQIGGVLGVSEGRVSQIRRTALRKMSEELQSGGSVMRVRSAMERPGVLSDNPGVPRPHSIRDRRATPGGCDTTSLNIRIRVPLEGKHGL
jgi:RNA polymerase sigma factor for flagellar operon FliA